MSLIVPLVAVSKQHLSVVLEGQPVDIWVRQLRTGLFMDVALAGALVCSNVICENLSAIVRAPYTGFVGDLSFYDTIGNSNPDYTGIGPGGRFQLRYLTAADLAQLAAEAA